VPLPLLDQQCGEDAAWLGGRDLALPSSVAPNAEGVTDGAGEIHSCPRPRTRHGGVGDESGGLVADAVCHMEREAAMGRSRNRDGGGGCCVVEGGGAFVSFTFCLGMREDS
jgi:hypothetical protein